MYSECKHVCKCAINIISSSLMLVYKWKKRYVLTCCFVTINEFHLHFSIKVFKWMYLHKMFLSYAYYIHYHIFLYFPVLQGAPSLQTPWHLTHLPFETYVPDVQTVKKQTTELIHEVNDSKFKIFIGVKATIYDSTVPLLNVSTFFSILA